METIIIAAVAKNGVIGKDNALPWHLPEDLEHFKQATEGHAIIMGRKTYESIGKPLPNRINIVLSRHLTSPNDKRFMVTSTLVRALNLCRRKGLDKAFLIGGSGVYQEALDEGMTDTMLLTELHDNYDGDTFFPGYDRTCWREMEREQHPAFDFVTYKR